MVKANSQRRRRSRGNGDGTFYQRKDGRWVASLIIDGKRNYWYGASRPDVEKKLREERGNHEKGLPVVDGAATAAKYLADWLELMRYRVRPTTWKAYEALLRLHAIPRLGNIRLAKLTARDLERLYAESREAGLSPASSKKLHVVLHRALRDAYRHGDVVRNVADDAQTDRVPRPEIHPLTSGQALRLLEVARGDKLEALYVLALTTGMRQGELLALRWSDVNLDTGWLRVTGTLQRGKGAVVAEPKTQKSRRRIELAATAVDALRRHRDAQPAGCDWVFPNQAGAPWNERNLVRREFEPLLSRAELPRIRWHDLRHSFASVALELGIPLKMVSEMLGHSTIAITADLYQHATPGMHRQAADLLGQALTPPSGGAHELLAAGARAEHRSP